MVEQLVELIFGAGMDQQQLLRVVAMTKAIERSDHLPLILQLGGQPDRLESAQGAIEAAFQTSVQDEENLEVEFSIASFPDQRFAGEVTHVNPGLEQDTDLGYVLPIEANPISDLPENVRAGIPVAAKVICGRRSFIYCKTYEFVDWVNRTAFEYVY